MKLTHNNHYPNMLKWIYRHGKQFERPIQFPDDKWAPVDTRICTKGTGKNNIFYERPCNPAALKRIMEEFWIDYIIPCGSRMSFSRIDEPVGVSSRRICYLDMSAFKNCQPFNKGTWIFGAGTSLDRAQAALEECGLSLPQLGQVTQQSVVGAIQTNTHGSGINMHSLAHYAVALFIMRGQDYVCLSRETIDKDLLRGLNNVNNVVDPDMFNAAISSHGLFGPITDVVLQVTTLKNWNETREYVKGRLSNLDLNDIAKTATTVEVLIHPYWNEYLVIRRNINTNTGGSPAPGARHRSCITRLPVPVRQCSAAIMTSLMPRQQAISLQLSSQDDEIYTGNTGQVLTNTLSNDGGAMLSLEVAVPPTHINQIVSEIRGKLQRAKREFMVDFPINIRYAPPDQAVGGATWSLPNKNIAYYCYVEIPIATSDRDTNRCLAFLKETEEWLIKEYHGSAHPGKTQRGDNLRILSPSPEHVRWAELNVQYAKWRRGATILPTTPYAATKLIYYRRPGTTV